MRDETDFRRRSNCDGADGVVRGPDSHLAAGRKSCMKCNNRNVTQALIDLIYHSYLHMLLAV